jgi:hypothetical protein
MRLIGLAVALLLFTVVALDASAPKSCHDADEHLEDGLVGKASTLYGSILEDEPDSGCAREGLRTVAQRRCSAGKFLIAGGAPEEGRKALVSLLATEPAEPAVSCALGALRALGETKKEPPSTSAPSCACPANPPDISKGTGDPGKDPADGGTSKDGQAKPDGDRGEEGHEETESDRGDEADDGRG